MYIDREKRLAHLKDPEVRQAMIRLLDHWERAFRHQDVELTGFFDPYYIQISSDLLKGLSEMSFSVYGGYDQAERARIAIYPTFIEEVDFQLGFIRVQGNFKFRQVTYRDYLGSLLGLGLTREKFVDIIVLEGGCQLITDKDIVHYLLANWIKVNQVPVQAIEISPEELVLPPMNYKEIKATVASPRLDAVLGIGFGCSRTRTLPDIKGGRVRVNYKTVNDPSFRLKTDDRISWQGRGRLQVGELTGPSQKGRLFIKIFRFV
jgi:RNA-binding protein YlmH